MANIRYVCLSDMHLGEELSLLFLSPNYRSVVGFLTILLVLIFRPRGILGQRAY